MFNRQNAKITIMGLVPTMIQQGGTISSFIISTMQTKPLGLMVVFTVFDLGSKRLFPNMKVNTKNSIGFGLAVLATTLITGPFLIEWAESTYNFINDKIIDITDDFFNYTSALGV